MNSISSDIPRAACNFASAVDDHIDLALDLNQHLIKHPAATFFVRAVGHSMPEVGILANDLLVIDRSLTPQDNSIVMVVVNGEFMLKRLKIVQGQGFLSTANKGDKTIAIANIDNFQFWGVVTYAIHDVRLS